MALDITNWIPIEWDDRVTQRVAQLSAVEANGRGVAMGTATKRVLRSAGMDVGTGSTYTEDASAHDYVLLDAVKFTGQAILDEDDLSDADSIVDTIRVKSSDWATSYAVAFDNSCLGVTAAANQGDVPFTSVYKAIRSNNTDTSYTADDNYVNWNGAASGAYDSFSDAFQRVESGYYWDPAQSLVIASPAYRDVFRRTKDNDGMPIFVQGTAGTPDTLFGVRVHWSLGAKTSATRSTNPSGNPLLIFVGNSDLLMRGDRSGPEALVDVARAHDSTDETALKLRVRKGFAVAHEGGFAVVENTGA